MLSLLLAIDIEHLAVVLTPSSALFFPFLVLFLSLLRFFLPLFLLFLSSLLYTPSTSLPDPTLPLTTHIPVQHEHRLLLHRFRFRRGSYHP